MYKISYPSGVLYLGDIPVPQDDRHPAYQAYVVWLRAGNGPEQIEDPVEKPLIDVSAWQIRKALNTLGLRQAVEDAVAGSANIEVKDGWYHAPRFYSDNPLIQAMGIALGKTPDEMHTLFQLAESL